MLSFSVFFKPLHFFGTSFPFLERKRERERVIIKPLMNTNINKLNVVARMIRRENCQSREIRSQGNTICTGVLI